jgi:hypothetical protein
MCSIAKETDGTGFGEGWNFTVIFGAAKFTLVVQLVGYCVIIPSEELGEVDIATLVLNPIDFVV